MILIFSFGIEVWNILHSYLLIESVVSGGVSVVLLMILSASSVVAPTPILVINSGPARTEYIHLSEMIDVAAQDDFFLN